MSSSPKSLIGSAALLSVGVWVAQFGSFTPPILTGSNKLMEQYEAFRGHVEHEGPFDIIVFGNSVARRGVDPIQLSEHLEERWGDSLRIYNFGVGGTTTPAFGYVVDMAYGVDQPVTALAVLGLRMAAAWAPRVNDLVEIRLTSPYGRAVTDPVRWRGKLQRWLLDHVQVFGLRFSLKAALLNEGEKVRRVGSYDGKRGYRPTATVGGADQRWDIVRERKKEWAPDAGRRQVLFDAIDHLTNRAKEVWLIQAPVHPKRLSMIEDSRRKWEQFGQVLVDVGDATGSRVLLIPDDLTFDSNDFADTTHLTPNAAARYTAWIGDELELGPWRDR